MATIKERRAKQARIRARKGKAPRKGDIRDTLPKDAIIPDLAKQTKRKTRRKKPGGGE